MSKWQPMDTAPKDGRHILLAITNGPARFPSFVTEGYYEERGDRGWFASNTHWTDFYDGQVLVFPSHWMPLPAPPAPREE